MNIAQAFPSKWIKPHDLNDKDVDVTIESFDHEETKDERGIQYFLTLKEFPKKQWGLNKTNSSAIAKLHGVDTDQWIGKRITLYATEVEAFGEQTMGIRVRLRAPSPAGNGQAAPAPAGPLGDAAAAKLTERLAALTAINKGVTLDSLRAEMVRQHPDQEAALAGEPATWPRSLGAAIKAWFEDAESVPF
jgi:hypothetical protein